MNILTTTFLAGSFAIMPVSAVPSVSLETLNPFDGLSISAAGIGFDVTQNGIETQPADTPDFEIELRLKSGSPIRVRL